jgi:hypothetical protein
MEKEKKIGFYDLTISLKVLVVLCWIVCGLLLSSFAIGFFIGLIEALA